MATVIWPSVVNGVGISFIFVPLTTATVAFLRQDQMGNATGMYNLMRNIGGSIGIAFVTTMLARDAQAHQAMMVSHTTPYDPAFIHQVAATKAALAAHGDSVAAAKQAYQLIYQRVIQQASLWAFVDNFRLFGVLSIACVPVIFLFKKVPHHPRAPTGAH
jgi:DHA2 family multidrug resistance protein